MKPIFVYFAAPLLLLLGGFTAASADDLHPGLGQDNPGASTAPAPPPPSADSSDKPDKPQPTFAYFLAVASTVIVLCILCVPSRKAESATARR